MFASSEPLALAAWIPCWFCGPLTGELMGCSYPADIRENATMLVAITITDVAIPSRKALWNFGELKRIDTRLPGYPVLKV